MSLSPFALIQLAIQFEPAIKAIIDEATTNDDIVTKIKALSPSFASVLEGLGAEFFPGAAPALHLIGGVIAAFDPNTTKWLQGSLNTLLSPSPNLTVDGIYGPRTKAAVVQLQTKLGLTPDGIAGMLTQSAIAAALAKLPKL
jgi:hypothetical protein